MSGIIGGEGSKSGVLGASPPNHAFKAYKTSSQSVPQNNTDLVVFHADAHSSWDGSKGFDLSNNYYKEFL